MNGGAFGENFPYTNFHNLNLDWIIKVLKNLINKEEEQNNNIENLKEQVSALEEWVDNYNQDFIQNTVLQYLESILAQMIFVEISDAGYFVYHIPNGWEEITFHTTGLDIELALQPQYGHLVLSY